MRQVDTKLKELFISVCTRPGMYVGFQSYEKAMVFIDGYVCGRADAEGIPFRETVLVDQFRVFLANRHNKGESLVWWCIPTRTKGWAALGEGEKLASIQVDFEDFANILTRLALEL